MRKSPEFERISALVRAIGAPAAPEVEIGPGDDAAVLRLPEPEALVVSTDVSVEDVHFRREWLTWDAIGYRAVAAALSDLAAMAARPVGVLVSLAVPPEMDGRTLEELADGMGNCLRESQVALLGGDLSRSPGPVVIDVAVLGGAERPVTRSGARPGDELWVTGRLGGAAAAAAAWARGLEPDPSDRGAFERPRPRLREARSLCEQADVHALVDLSDGLASDAEQMAAASGVRLVLETGRVPLHDTLEAWALRDAALALAVGGGEDYELLASVAPGTVRDTIVEGLGEVGTQLTRIGTVKEGAGVEWVGPKGELVEPPAAGFDHFAAKAGS